MAVGYLVMGLIFSLISIPYFMIILEKVGFPPVESAVIALFASFMGLLLSPVNIVVKEVDYPVYRTVVERVEVFGIPFYYPKVTLDSELSRVAVNAGGALVPVTVSLLMLSKLQPTELFLTLAGVIVMTLLINRIAKVVPGLGIVTPAFIPPLLSVLVSLLLFSSNPEIVPVSSYISGVLGSLLGADILNMRKVLRNAPPMVSIGGMGTFDGIYVTGIFAVFISVIIRGLL